MCAQNNCGPTTVTTPQPGDNKASTGSNTRPNPVDSPPPISNADDRFSGGPDGRARGPNNPPTEVNTISTGTARSSIGTHVILHPARQPGRRAGNHRRPHDCPGPRTDTGRRTDRPHRPPDRQRGVQHHRRFDVRHRSQHDDPRHGAGGGRADHAAVFNARPVDRHHGQNRERHAQQLTAVHRRPRPGRSGASAAGR